MFRVNRTYEQVGDEPDDEQPGHQHIDDLVLFARSNTGASKIYGRDHHKHII